MGDMTMAIDRITSIIETQEMEPVYCGKCKWYREKEPDFTRKDRCIQPEIIAHKEWIKSTAIREGYYSEWECSGTCAAINIDNDCEKYEAKRVINRG